MAQAADQRRPILVAHVWDMPIPTGYEAGPPIDPWRRGVGPTSSSPTVAECADARVEGRLIPAPRAGDRRPRRGDVAGEDVTVVVGHSGSSKAACCSARRRTTSSTTPRRRSSSCAASCGCRSAPWWSASTGRTTTSPTTARSGRCAGRCGLPGVERVEVSHADFVPGVAAGPVVEPGLESDDARPTNDALVRQAIDGPPTAPAMRRTAPRSSRWSPPGPGRSR